MTINVLPGYVMRTVLRNHRTGGRNGACASPGLESDRLVVENFAKYERKQRGAVSVLMR
jgi:hypothetical protein